MKLSTNFRRFLVSSSWTSTACGNVIVPTMSCWADAALKFIKIADPSGQVIFKDTLKMSCNQLSRTYLDNHKGIVKLHLYQMNEISKLGSILYSSLFSRNSFLSKIPNRKNKINDFSNLKLNNRNELIQ